MFNPLTIPRVIGVLAVALGLALPSRAAAQDDCVEVLECQWCVQATEQDAHKFGETGAQNCNNDEYNPYHSE